MTLGDFFKASLNNFFRSMMNEAPSWGEEILHRAKLEIWRFEKKLIKSLISISILLLSFIALALSAIFFLIEYLNMTKALAFLIIGIILLIIGIILKL